MKLSTILDWFVKFNGFLFGFYLLRFIELQMYWEITGFTVLLSALLLISVKFEQQGD